MKLKKSFIICLYLGVMLFLLSPCVHAQGIEALKGKKVLYVYGGWEGHEPEQCRDIFVPWLEAAGAEVFVSDSLACYKDSVLMQQIISNPQP